LIRAIRKIRIQKAFFLFGSGPSLPRALAGQARPGCVSQNNEQSFVAVPFSLQAILEYSTMVHFVLI
jgi:hypothetical protein